MKSRFQLAPWLAFALVASFCTSCSYTSPPASKRSGASAAYRFEPQSRAVLAAAGVTSSRDPKLYLDSSGAIYLLAVIGDHSQSQLGFSVSHDGGDSFAPANLLSRREASVSSHGENSPSFTFSGWPFIYSLWEQNTTNGGSDILFARFNMATNQLEGPVRVTDKKTASANIFPFMTAKPYSGIYAVWLDGRNPQAMPPGTFEIYLAKSEDQGTSFGRNVLVSAAGCPCCRPVLSFGQKGEIYVAFRTVLEGDIRDIMVSTSQDQGESFLPPQRVSEDNWKISGCPHSGPSLAVTVNRLYIAWYSETAKGKPGVWLSWSDDGAKSFSPAVQISGDILDANHPALSVSEDGRVLLVFQGRDPQKNEGWDSARVYLAEIDSSGKIAGPIAISGSHKAVSYPTVSAGTAGRVFVAWTESTDKGPQIFLSRGRRFS